MKLPSNMSLNLGQLNSDAPWPLVKPSRPMLKAMAGEEQM